MTLSDVAKFPMTRNVAWPRYVYFMLQNCHTIKHGYHNFLQ